MANNFKAFMIRPMGDTDVIKYVASERFVKEDGTFEEWELKPISSDLDEAIRKRATKKVPVQGKRGQYNMETDNDKYIGDLCVACIAYPNLNDAALQDFFGVKTPDALLKQMLLLGEYTDLKAKVMEINGYDMSMEDKVAEAKN